MHVALPFVVALLLCTPGSVQQHVPASQHGEHWRCGLSLTGVQSADHTTTRCASDVPAGKHGGPWRL